MNLCVVYVINEESFQKQFMKNTLSFITLMKEH